MSRVFGQFLSISTIVTALATSAHAAPSRVEVSVISRADLGTTKDTVPFGDTDGSWLGGDTRLALSIFAPRIAEDGAPPPLQPFLQRISQVHLEAGGGGSLARSPSGFETASRLGFGSITAEWFATRWLLFQAFAGVTWLTWRPARGAAVSYETSSGQELIVRTSTEIGVRWSDFFVGIGWGVTPFAVSRGGPMSMSVRFWGNAFAAFRAVLRRAYDLSATVEVLESGAFVRGALTAWTRPRVGITVAVEGGRGGFFDSAGMFSRVGGQVGISWWMAPFVGATVAYEPAWQSSSSMSGWYSAEQTSISHILTFTATARAPR